MPRRLARRSLAVSVVLLSALPGLPLSPYSFPAFADVKADKHPPGPPPRALTAAEREPVLALMQEDGTSPTPTGAGPSPGRT